MSDRNLVFQAFFTFPRDRFIINSITGVENVFLGPDLIDLELVVICFNNFIDLVKHRSIHLEATSCYINAHFIHQRKLRGMRLKSVDSVELFCGLSMVRLS